MIHQSLWTNTAIFCNKFVQDIELLSWLYNKRSNFKHYSKSCCILVSLDKIQRPAQHIFCGTYTHFKFTVISYQSTNYSNMIVSVGFLRSATSFIHSYTYCSIKTLQQIKFKHCYVLTCCIPVSSNKIPRTTQHKRGWRCIVISCSFYLVFRHTTYIIHTNYMHTNSNIQLTPISSTTQSNNYQ